MSCDWPVDRSCFDDLPPEPEPPGDGASEQEQAAYAAAVAEREALIQRRNMAEDTAVMVLWAFTGRQFGLCETTVRPCPGGGGPRDMRPWSQPLLWWDGTHWLNASCGCVGRCQVSGPGVVHLPSPAAEVLAVTLGDTVLDESEYVLEGNALYRRGGKAWPSQDLGRPLGERGTWSVQYLRGLPVPAGGDKMAGLLAKEFVSACDGGVCRLPRTVVQTTRQGVTHVFDATKLLDLGYTGLTEVDTWLAAINPHHLQQAPVVL
ncbi:head-to-tail adaptor [Mycobacterium phage Allegro]|nr:head-to-tail adaptor [Mycobacterium phage Allegro]